MTNWTAEQMPELRGKVAVVTGGNSGVGYESVLELARRHAHVVLGARNPAKAEQAYERIMQQVPNASIELLPLDLANLESVHAFVKAFHDCNDRLDILINNAGIAAATRHETKDGFELQLGVNHLGHFALTGLLLDDLLATPNSRIVTVSSALYTSGWLDFNDLHQRNQSTTTNGYATSKLANIHFMRELYHRLARIGSTTLSLAAHPGLSQTEMKIEGTGWVNWVRFYFNIRRRLLGQSAAMGALPQLYAATAAEARSGTLIGPHRGRTGFPRVEPIAAHALDRDIGARLWEISEALTGVRYDALRTFQPLRMAA